jgi:hypothetical protein
MDAPASFFAGHFDQNCLTTGEIEMIKTKKHFCIVRFLDEFALYIEGDFIDTFKSIQEIRSHCRRIWQDHNWNYCDSY